LPVRKSYILTIRFSGNQSTACVSQLDATLRSEAHAAVLRASVPGRGRTASVSRSDEDGPGQTTTSTSTTRTALPTSEDPPKHSSNSAHGACRL
jgi:hypothetical protein